MSISREGPRQGSEKAFQFPILTACCPHYPLHTVRFLFCFLLCPNTAFLLEDKRSNEVIRGFRTSCMALTEGLVDGARAESALYFMLLERLQVPKGRAPCRLAIAWRWRFLDFPGGILG
jgi:hypothetical protein